MIIAPPETPAAQAAAHPPRSVEARSQRALAWQQFTRHRLAVAGVLVLTLLCLSALAAPLSPYDVNRTNLRDRFAAPSLLHPMGTDDLGRDEATRLFTGGRLSLAVGVLATAVSIAVGTLVGACAGYFGGWLDSVLMRFTELVIAFPPLFVLILLAVLVGTSFWTITLVIGLLRWMSVARLVRVTYLQLKQRDFVIAARALGASDAPIMWRHILPNALSPLIVSATLQVAGAILTESTLSFLGLGIQLPTATWGNMLRTAQENLTPAPWLAFFPGLFIFLSILSVNYIGDGVRDAVDPRRAG